MTQDSTSQPIGRSGRSGAIHIAHNDGTYTVNTSGDGFAYANDGKLIAFGGTVRALGDGRHGGYLLRYTERDKKDLYRTYFDENTDHALDEHPLEGKPILFNHGTDKRFGFVRLGVIDRAEIRLTPDADGNRGVWVEWLEDRAQEKREYMEMIRRLDEYGIRNHGHGNGLSGGAYPASVIVDKKTGHVDRWVFAEASITHVPGDSRNQIPHDRIYQLTDLQTELLRESTTKEADATQDKQHNRISKHNRSNRNMDALIEKLLALISEYQDEMGSMDEAMADDEMRMDEEDQRSLAQDLMKRIQPTLDAMAQSSQPTDEQIERALKAHGDEMFKATAERVYKAQAEKRAKREDAVRKAKEAAERAEPPVSKASQVGGTRGKDTMHNIQVGDNRKYSHMSFEDMAFAHNVLKQAGRSVSDDFMVHMAHKANDAMKRDDIPGINHSAVRSVMPWRANELDASNITGQGAEWVGVAYSSTLWEKIRVATIYQQFQSKGMMEFEIPQGMESIYVPTEGADPTFYNIAQPNDVDTSQRPEVVINQTPVATSRQQLQTGTVGAAVTYSYILEEDSIIAVASQFRNQLERRSQEVIENLMINGDTATAANTNINLIDGTPATGLESPFYITTNGFLKLALVTNTALSGTAGNKLSEDIYLNAYGLLPKNQRADKSRLLFLTDPDTELATLRLPSIKTRDVNSAATIESGNVTRMWGIDMSTSNEMDLANTAGKISATASNNTRGRIACLRPDRWSFAFKRDTTFEVATYPLSQAKTIVVTFRVGMKEFSTTGGAAVQYNVAV